ncbi:MAG: tetratricopeptide repeat protein [Opitutae bacterium]|nr:tetratricopeptide repeat protein [Opitutae bacterium]
MKNPANSMDKAMEPGKGFAFFPPRAIDANSEGRDPHDKVKEDLMARQFPTERQIGVFLFLASLLLYLASMSWAPFPGLPTQALLMHLELDVSSSARNPLWGLLVKGFARLPGLSVSGWMGLFSALCGATCASLLGRLMVRVGYLIRNEPGRTSFMREAQARRLSGLVAGLYLACCIPFWMVSTRSLPGSFHVLLLLAAAWLFSEYQHWGRLRHLGCFGVLFGIGMVEFATFIVFLPLAVFLVAREIFRWRARGSWRAQLAIWGGLLLGLSLYPLQAFVLFRQGAPWDLFASPGQAWALILREQLQLILHVRYSPGFMVIMFLCLVPWLTLFVMSRRSPWFYEGWQIAVRLIIVVGLVGVLYNASYAPWNLLGLSYLMVTPYLLLAICMGYIAGEFWIIGEPQVLVDRLWHMRFARRVSGVFAWLLPVAVALAGIHNWRIVDGRHGRVVAASADEILDRLAGRDLLFSNGFLDDSLRLAVRTRQEPVRLVSALRTTSPLYLRRLADSLAEEALKVPLNQGNFGQFLENLLLADEGPARTAIIDMPEVFREFGYLVPDGFLYRLETSADRVDLPAIVEAQRSFWARMVRLAEHPAPKGNLARRHQDLLCLLASKVANNLGVMQAERGNAEEALETFRTARRICPENFSALLNLMEMGRHRELPEAEALAADWEDRQRDLEGVRWALAIRYGYVWKAREWVRRGWVWVLSGAPIFDEAARFQSAAPEDDSDGRAQLLDQAYLVWGVPTPEENVHRGQLIQDGKNTVALMALCRISLRRNDPDAAEAYMAEAMAMGLPEEGVLFDRAMATYVRGDPKKAVAALEALSLQTPGDARIWMALVLLTDERDPLNGQAMKKLKSHRSAGIGVWLSLASLHMSRQRWGDAQAELERAVQMDSKNTQVWEMMVTLSQESGNLKLMEASLRALLNRNPEHYLQYQNQGVAFYQRGKMAEAEAAFRQGIQRRRDPTLLNNLASVIMERDGDLQEALELMNEALRRQPGNEFMRSTRGELHLKMGRFKEALTDLQVALKKRGRKNDLLLLLARSYEGAGDRTRALTVAKAMAARPDQLDDEQKRQVKEMLLRLR